MFIRGHPVIQLSWQQIGAKRENKTGRSKGEEEFGTGGLDIQRLREERDPIRSKQQSFSGDSEEEGCSSSSLWCSMAHGYWFFFVVVLSAHNYRFFFFIIFFFFLQQLSLSLSLSLSLITWVVKSPEPIAGYGWESAMREWKEMMMMNQHHEGLWLAGCWLTVSPAPLGSNGSLLMDVWCS